MIHVVSAVLVTGMLALPQDPPTPVTKTTTAKSQQSRFARFTNLFLVPRKSQPAAKPEARSIITQSAAEDTTNAIPQPRPVGLPRIQLPGRIPTQVRAKNASHSAPDKIRNALAFKTTESSSEPKNLPQRSSVLKRISRFLRPDFLDDRVTIAKTPKPDAAVKQHRTLSSKADSKSKGSDELHEEVELPMITQLPDMNPFR